MSIKIQERDMLVSARKINSEIAKVESFQRELKNMLNSTHWDMRAKRNMESQLEDARKLNKELILITNNMSYVIKNTTDSMRERDLQLSKTMNNNSVTSSNNNVQGESDNGRLSIFDVDPDFNLFEDLKDGDLAVDIGVEGSIISWDKDANFGNSTIGGSAGIDLDVGNVVAKGEVSADIKNGDFGASGQLGAYVGKGEISGSFNFGPIEISGSVGGLVGIGAGGNIGFEDGKFGIGGNIACGPGVDFGVSIGINDEWFKELFK